MKVLIIALALFGSSAFAATNAYELQMDVSFNGKHIASPRVLVAPGEKALIVQKTKTEEATIEIVSTESEMNGSKGILSKMEVSVVDNNGKRLISAKPQIFAVENEKAEITVGEKTGEISVALTAKRTALKR